ncbi:helix-turn-helix domain-containing protein [Cupriavidus necator]
MPSLRQIFAHNLKRLREARSWSQDDLGRRMGTDRTTVSRIERLAPNVALDKVRLVADALEVDATQLLETADSDERALTRKPIALTPEAVGGAVRRLREEQGLSQRELGDRVGLDRNHISRIELGSTNIALDTLEKIAAALGVSATDLLGQP